MLVNPTQEEFDKLYNECSSAIKPIVLLARHTGLRKGEVLNLKWEDVDFKSRLIYVTESKNNERREVPMNETVCRTLKTDLLQYGGGECRQTRVHTESISENLQKVVPQNVNI
ncbi:MAG: tyrosine-type recombinase/integrase [Acidobacteriota bacterium]